MINAILTVVALFMCVVIWSLRDIRGTVNDTNIKVSQLYDIFSWLQVEDASFYPDK